VHGTLRFAVITTVAVLTGVAVALTETGVLYWGKFRRFLPRDNLLVDWIGILLQDDDRHWHTPRTYVRYA
jgi:hypothetical protein